MQVYSLSLCHSPVFPSTTRLLTVSESIAEVPQRQVAEQANRHFLVSSASSSLAGLPRYSLKQLQ